jgi:hypothetical protein
MRETGMRTGKCKEQGSRSHGCQIFVAKNERGAELASNCRWRGQERKQDQAKNHPESIIALRGSQEFIAAPSDSYMMID